jgi:hypothetical protein
MTDKVECCHEVWARVKFSSLSWKQHVVAFYSNVDRNNINITFEQPTHQFLPSHRSASDHGWTDILLQLSGIKPCLPHRERYLSQLNRINNKIIPHFVTLRFCQRYHRCTATRPTTLISSLLQTFDNSLTTEPHHCRRCCTTSFNPATFQLSRINWQLNNTHFWFLITVGTNGITLHLQLN